MPWRLCSFSSRLPEAIEAGDIAVPPISVRGGDQSQNKLQILVAYPSFKLSPTVFARKGRPVTAYRALL
jgi:hypothetical protein